MDGLPGERHRALLIGALDTALDAGAAEQRDRKTGQASLFGLIEAPKVAPGAVRQGESYPEVEAWTHKQLLAFEKEALGFYISGHPLDRYRSDLTRYANAGVADFAQGRRGVGEASIGGIVAQYREMITKKGDKMARFFLEDADGAMEVVAFPKTFERVRTVLVSDEPILCTGAMKNEGSAESPEWKMLLENAQVLADLRSTKTTRVEITLAADSVTQEQIDELKHILSTSPGTCASYVRLRIAGRSETLVALGDTWQVAASDELLLRLERVFGDRVATLG